MQHQCHYRKLRHRKMKDHVQRRRQVQQSGVDDTGWMWEGCPSAVVGGVWPSQKKMQYFLLKCTLVHFQRADVEIAWMQQHTVLCSYQSYYRPIRPILLKLVNRYNSENFRVKCKGLQCQIVCKLKIRANQQTTTLEWINSLYGSLNNKFRALPTATMTI